MDESARAATGYCAALASLSHEAYSATRAMADGKQLSPQKISIHVIRAALAFADDIRRVRGMETRDHGKITADVVPDAASVKQRIADALKYTEESLEGLYDAEWKECAALEFKVSWGKTYDPEMILEHGICHFLRHRRQIDRWLAA